MHGHGLWSENQGWGNMQTEKHIWQWAVQVTWVAKHRAENTGGKRWSAMNGFIHKKQ